MSKNIYETEKLHNTYKSEGANVIAGIELYKPIISFRPVLNST
jgi:hypothetical protein